MYNGIKYFISSLTLVCSIFLQAQNHYTDIFFLDDHKGWILSSDGYIWKTTNAGNDWLRIYDSRIDTSGKITFINERDGWLILNNRLLRTINGGLNWIQEYEFPSVLYGYTVAFANDSIGFAYSNNRLFKSMDGGNNWELVTDTLHRIYDVSFYKDSVGYLCFNYSTSYLPVTTRYIYKTTNLGETWNYSFSEAGPLQEMVYYNKINIINSNVCIIGGFYESLFGMDFSLIKTTDTGATWENKYGCYPWALDLEFISSQVGWAVNWIGIMKTTDCGSSWDSWDTLQTFTTWEDRNTNFEFFDSNNSYMINLNHIYKTTDGWVTYSIVDSVVTGTDEPKNLPTEYILKQNYPNPFNPFTKISWQSPSQGWQTLKIYDLLGNEVATLVDEYKPAGVYVVEFNASSLSSGVYFYRLSTGNFTKTNKMILLK